MQFSIYKGAIDCTKHNRAITESRLECAPQPLTFLTRKAHSPIMPIKYYPAPEIKKQVDAIASDLELFHVVPQFVFCVRSKGSKAKRTIARIHGLGKIWQDVLNIPPSYTIEVISEIYDKMSKEEKEKTLIHELLHIPGGFSGGFRPHKGYVERKIVEQLYKKLQQARASKRTLLDL
jgi:predicted metallopeptidase